MTVLTRKSACDWNDLHNRPKTRGSKTGCWAGPQASNHGPKIESKARVCHTGPLKPEALSCARQQLKNKPLSEVREATGVFTAQGDAQRLRPHTSAVVNGHQRIRNTLTQVPASMHSRGGDRRRKTGAVLRDAQRLRPYTPTARHHTSKDIMPGLSDASKRRMRGPATQRCVQCLPSHARRCGWTPARPGTRCQIQYCRFHGGENARTGLATEHDSQRVWPLACNNQTQVCGKGHVGTDGCAAPRAANARRHAHRCSRTPACRAAKCLGPSMTGQWRGVRPPG